VSKSPTISSDPPHLAGAAVRAARDGDVDALETVADQQRVIELPPPPTGLERPLRVDAAGTASSGWRGWWRIVGRRLSSGCGASFLFHFVLLVVLALIAQAVQPQSEWRGLTAYTYLPVPIRDLDSDLANDFRLSPNRHEGVPGEPEPAYRVPEVPSPLATVVDIDPARRQTPDSNSARLPDLLLQTDASVAGLLAGRGRDARAAMAAAGGGTPESEGAVERGLRWLMAHQREDGSWNFDHNKSSCRGLCRNPGNESSTTAATAMVLLPFLGAGYTHTEGEYQNVVQQGVYYLMKRTLVTPHGHDLREGTMYAQGLGTIALCEAYAMTKDPALEDYAQGAIDFVCYAQDRNGGGWRYTPGEPGDTTVTGWQLMGLKSGQMAGLLVPRPTVYLVHRFLDGVESDYGAQYGYMSPQPRQATTAIGLLCRMYTGWRRDRPALARGVKLLDEWGPSETNMYYNYYATQVLHHWHGPEWQRWNPKMRDYLVATQAATSHEAGSWYFPDRHGDKGGRLYNTAMAVMILEVYYRYMPIYRQQAVEGEL